MSLNVQDPEIKPIDRTERNEISAQIGKVVSSVRDVYQSGRTTPMEWRLEQLDGLVRMLNDNTAQFEQALADDLGKPGIEGFAADIRSTANEISYLRKHAAKWAKPRKVKLPMTAKPGSGRIVPEPLGVALVIAPWNYPIQLLLLPVAAAIAAGNSVIAKPSEVSPATSNALAELIPRYIDSEAVAVCEGGVDVATALLEQRFDHIFYTGSTGVGRIVYEAAAKHLTPVVLELGGKSPVVVHNSAKIDVAARRVAWGKWLNAGQTCVAPDYVLITKDVRERFVDALQQAFTEFADERGTKTNPDYSSIVSERHAERLRGLLADHGGAVAVGGDVDTPSRYVEPTVVVDPNVDSDLMNEEIFGPVLPIVTVESTTAAIEFINGREKPLALYVFAEDEDVSEQILDSTSSGGACVNHVVLHLTPPELPFGGVGQSGTGRYHGKSGFDTFSNLKSVLNKPTSPDPKFLYPPYTKVKERIIRKLL